jgi:hypothetical protein
MEDVQSLVKIASSAVAITFSSDMASVKKMKKEKVSTYCTPVVALVESWRVTVLLLLSSR